MSVAQALFFVISYAARMLQRSSAETCLKSKEPTMANTANRGGKKQGGARAEGAAKKIGVRAGSTAAAKERHQKAPRRPAIER